MKNIIYSLVFCWTTISLGLSIIYFKETGVTFPNRDVFLYFLNKFRNLRSTLDKTILNDMFYSKSFERY